MMHRLILWMLIIGVAGCVRSTRLTAIDNIDNAEDNAEVVIIRPGVFGTAIRARVYHNHDYIGYLGPRSYMAWEVAPGKHDIGSSSENYVIKTIDAEPGKTYYFKQRMGFGIVQPRVFLTPIDSSKALSYMRNMRPPVATPLLKGRGHRKSLRAKAEREL